MNKKPTRCFTFIDTENIKSTAQEIGYNDFDYEKVYDWFIKNKKIDKVFLSNENRW